MRKLIVLLFLFGFVPSAHAVTALCQGGFKPCDPTSGTCYTTWTATNAGQVQAQCATDPSSCFRAMLGEPACAPVPPVNPQAIRVCPEHMDCGPNFPLGIWGMPDYGPRYDNPTGEPQWWRNNGAGGKVRAHIACYYRDSVGFHVALEPVVYFNTMAENAVNYYYLDLFNAPPGQLNTFPHCPACTAYVADRIARLAALPMPPDGHPGTMAVCQLTDAMPGTPFEPPGGACSWTITPSASGEMCVQAGSPLPLALKTINLVGGGKTTSERLQERHDALLNDIVKLEKNLKDGLYGTVNSIWARAERMWRVTMIQEVLQIAQAMVDPPNTNYQAIPGLPGLATPDTITAGFDMTQAQADAWNAWALKSRRYHQAWGQLHDTYDNLAGAMNAQDALWVRRLALAAEDVAADLAAKWTKDVNSRAALVALYPNHPDLAAGCSTPTDMLVRLRDVAANGDRLFGGFLQYQDGLADPCASTASTFADAMTSMPAEIITAFATPGIRHRVGAATGFDSSRTTTTLIGVKQNLVGKITLTATVAAQAGEPYGVKAGDLVQVSIPGLAPIPDQVLGTTKSVLIKLVGVPAGTYTVTVTYPEQRAGKMVASTATVSVVVK